MGAAQRQAPAFQIELKPQPKLQGLLALLAAVSAACLFAGLALHSPACWWLMALLPVITWLGWRAAAVTPRHLQWDGQCWRVAAAGLREPGVPVEIRVVIDLDDWLLLRTQPVGRRLPCPLFLPLSEAQSGASWGSLRATLYAARTRVPP